MKISNKDVIWNYLGYGITFGINLLILPFVLRYLSPVELGLWYVFISIGAFVTLFDFGFAPQVGRSITYALSGAKELKPNGFNRDKEINSKSIPNYKLLHEIISASKLLYFLIATVSFILLLILGSLYLNHINGNQLNVNNLLFSWFIYCVGCFLNLKYSFFNSFFRGIAEFVQINKAIVVSRSVQLISSIILIFLGYGILALSIAYTLNTIIFRIYLYNAYKQNEIVSKISILHQTKVRLVDKIKVLKIIWHNAWRDGLVSVSAYLVAQSNTLLCSAYYGLEITATFALTVQIISFIASASTIVFGTIQPLLNESSYSDNIDRKRYYFSIAWVSFFLSYFIMILMVIAIGFPLLQFIKSKTQIDLGVFVFYAFYILLTTNFSISASYISSSNKLPYSFPFFISALCSVVLAVLVSEYTSLNVWGLMISHMIVQLIYNIWKWPLYVFKELNLTPLKMIINVFGIFKNKFIRRFA